VVITTLNDLTQRLLILAAPYGYVVTTRLPGGAQGSCLELKARRAAPDGAALEYARLISLTELEHQGAAVIADRFSREARQALSGAEPPRVSAPVDTQSMDSARRSAHR
jgi:hypothetical protein